MDRHMALVLSIDPGEDCGWALGRGTTLLEYGQPDSDTCLRWISHEMIRPNLAIARLVWERFDLRQNTPEAAATIEVIGVLKFFARTNVWSQGEVTASAKRKTMSQVAPEVKGHARDAEAVRLWDLDYGQW